MKHRLKLLTSERFRELVADSMSDDESTRSRSIEELATRIDLGEVNYSDTGDKLRFQRVHLSWEYFTLFLSTLIALMIICCIVSALLWSLKSLIGFGILTLSTVIFVVGKAIRKYLKDEEKEAPWLKLMPIRCLLWKAACNLAFLAFAAFIIIQFGLE